MKPRPLSISLPKRTPRSMVSKTESASRYMTRLITAAPALVPAMTPPFAIDVPDGLEHRRVSSLGSEQRLDDPILFAADQEDAGRAADFRDEFGVGHGLLRRRRHLPPRHGNEERVGTRLVQGRDHQSAVSHGIAVSGGKDGDARAGSAREFDDVVPVLAMIEAFGAADDDERPAGDDFLRHGLLCGRRLTGPEKADREDGDRHPEGSHQSKTGKHNATHGTHP